MEVFDVIGILMNYVIITFIFKFVFKFLWIIMEEYKLIFCVFKIKYMILNIWVGIYVVVLSVKIRVDMVYC